MQEQQSQFANLTEQLQQQFKALGKGQKAFVIVPAVLNALVAFYIYIAPSLSAAISLGGLFVLLSYIILITVWHPLSERIKDVAPMFIVFAFVVFLLAISNPVKRSSPKPKYTNEDASAIYNSADECTRAVMDKAAKEGIPPYSTLIKHMASECNPK